MPLDTSILNTGPNGFFIRLWGVGVGQGVVLGVRGEGEGEGEGEGGEGSGIMVRSERLGVQWDGQAAPNGKIKEGHDPKDGPLEHKEDNIKWHVNNKSINFLYLELFDYNLKCFS